MVRRLLGIALRGGTVAGVCIAWAAAPPVASAADDGAAKAPVQRIVLFNSGVGYFEHRGEVEGNASIELKFDVDDVNDLLKSMVLEDRGGGRIAAVTYGSRDPITKTLETFSIDLTSSPTLGQLLAQIRGERVVIDAGPKIEGAIVGVETRRETVRNDQVIEHEYLNLLTAEGLQRVSLDSVRRIKLARPELDEELTQALSTLAAGHAEDKKSVTLEFLGEGKRYVRVGYIQEAPVWKTSYRLVLDDERAPFLQGWAIVENTTDADWKDVRLSLVSGRPISFTMDLYSPLYAQRAVETPEVFASLRPQSYEQDLGKFPETRHATMPAGLAAAATAAPAAAEPEMAAARFSLRGAAPADEAPAFLSEGLSTSVQAAAQAGEVGELFKYEIDEPVTLARQSSAMLPIINGEIEGEKVSIYNAAAHPKHPLNGVRIKNSSDLHLMQGPVTVYDGGVYAGDAKLPDLPAGSDRLVSYAVDLDVEVAPTSDATPQRITSARIDKGVMTTTFKQTRTQSYRVKNSGDKAKNVLIEFPAENEWKLVAPKDPAEKTRDAYRFAVETPAGESADLKIELEQVVSQQVMLGGLSDQAVKIYLATAEVPEKVKEALREVNRRSTELAEMNGRKQQLEQQIAAIGQEQERIRPNMESIDRNTDLYNRYVKKLNDQEDEIESLREQLRALDQQIVETQRAFDAYLAELTLE